MSKRDSALRTIGEMSKELGVPHHILRYWEEHVPQLKPLHLRGSRRYYRPADVELLRRIDRMLHVEGYTLKGVARVLSSRGGGMAEGAPAMPVSAAVPLSAATPVPAVPATAPPAFPPGLEAALSAIRDRLARALAEDDVAAKLAAQP